MSGCRYREHVNEVVLYLKLGATQNHICNNLQRVHVAQNGFKLLITQGMQT